MIPSFEMRHSAGHKLVAQTWGAVAVAGVGLVGSAMTSSATKDAAAGQQAASAQANALQQYMYDNNVKLQAPAINTGNAARDRLSYLLGLSPTGYSGGAGGAGGAAPLTYDALRQQLIGQYTKNVSSDGTPRYASAQQAIDALGQAGAYAYFSDPKNNVSATGSNGAAFGPGQGPGYWETAPGAGGDAGYGQQWVSTANQTSSQIDESGLDAEIKKRLADQDAQQQAAISAAKNDPNYGRLAQEFQFNTYTPDTFSYTGQDLYNDPSYQFRLDQGQKAIDRQGAASGRFLSGAQLQASSNYNQGAASQEFQNAYQRALGTFGTNETNKYNAFTTNEGNRFNAFQSNFNNAVNPLLALSGAATLGSQNLGSAGASVANQMGNNLTSNANAQGAAGIASANQIANTGTSLVNGYQQNQLMNSLLNRGSVNNNPSSGGAVNIGSQTYNPNDGSSPW